MARTHCLILGGGFGGVAAAHRLRERLGERVEITLVDRRSTFLMGLRLLWTIVGAADRAGGTRPLAALERHGIHYVRDEVMALDLDGRRVRTRRSDIAYDILLVALGADLRPDAVPGYDPAGSNFYDQDQAEAIAARLAAVEGGRIGVGILSVPYKCPPAPYEAVVLIDDLLRRRGVRNRVELEVFTPQTIALPVAGQEVSAMVERMLAERSIAFLPGHKAQAVERHEVIFDSERRAYDILLAVPPHRAPAVLTGTGLLSGAWVRPDPATCATAYPGVYAVGDATEMPLANGMALPKAGIFAEAQALAAADHIAATLGGPEPEHRFDGVGYCFMEAGGGQAAFMRGAFFATPAPEVRPEPPSQATLAEKRAFEASRLMAWF